MVRPDTLAEDMQRYPFWTAVFLLVQAGQDLEMRHPSQFKIQLGKEAYWQFVRESAERYADPDIETKLREAGTILGVPYELTWDGGTSICLVPLTT